MWWMDSQRPKSPEKVLTLEAIQILDELRATAKSAQDDYEAAYVRFRAAN
jgi:hypothetical protein